MNSSKIGNAILTGIISIITAFIIKTFWLGKVKGIPNIPNTACIIISNHASYLDFLLIGYVLTRKANKQFYFWAKTKVVQHSLWKIYSNIFNTIEVSADGNFRKLTNRSIQVLKGGENICVFPEGMRTRNGELLKFKEGYLKLASNAEAEVVPVFLENTYNTWPSHKMFPKALKCNITFYPPMKISKNLTCLEIKEINLSIMNKYNSWSKERN